MTHQATNTHRPQEVTSRHRVTVRPFDSFYEVKNTFPEFPVTTLLRLPKGDLEPGNALERRSIVQHDIDVLWHKIEVLTHKAKSPIVAITSTAPCEGKTFVAQHLALRARDGGERTLLFDGDFHRCSAQVGLVDGTTIDWRAQELLRGSRNLSDAIFRTQFPKLDFIGFPEFPDSPEQTERDFDPRAIRSLRETFHASRYESVIIDLPPFNTSSSSHNLLFSADVAVFCIRLNDQGSSTIEAALRSLEKRWGVEKTIICVGNPDNRLHAGITTSVFDML